MFLQIRPSLLALPFIVGVTAGFWPFHTQVDAVESDATSDVKQIAIIGARWFCWFIHSLHLHKLAQGIDVNITVFERSSYVGGRSTTVNAYNDPGHPVELGASIFVSVNEILMNATKESGLDLNPLADEEQHETIGIWNGEKFYGMSPILANKLMKATVAKFLKLYQPPFFPFRSLSERVVELDLISATGVTGDQLLVSNSVYPPFTTDIIQAFTRINYLQNLGVIHGLETMVSMATDGATQVKGGNWQMFDRMLNASGATVYLDTAVSSLEKNSARYTLTSKPAKAARNAVASEQKFDSVVIAAPFQYSGLKLSEDLVEKTPDEIPYPGDVVPTTVYTTLSPSDDPTSRTDIVGKAGFFSVIPEVESLLASPNDDITWFYPHVWNSYPYEYPRVAFEDIELARGLYYTAGIESFISTMETSALMGKNVAQLLVEDFTELLGGVKSEQKETSKVVEEL
ncbi:hypothetical protein GMDG_01348 [Pseudogymnoascus destructans 20631-21]|uniref:Prenylcysteine lyase domain-containing protein n=1 Tax=Pseudogymnoascus destructans (strain ATCC MYA-4855 / 20631-21) TaxID=658429 RepID=L8FTC6_PSED2|nr:hypothetical protein GMDG_01348 [Pseudogymnoascus destructans 20631-21]